MKAGYKTAIIGCGMISKNHVKALKNIENTHCIAVCDMVQEKADKAAKEYGIKKIFYNYQDMLKDPEIDVVHICTPHYLHAQMAIDCLLAGKHVLCEKPMALSKADGLRMIEARNNSKKQLAICFQNRYNEASVFMKDMMESGKLGAVIGARGQVTWDRKPEYYTESKWRGSWEKEGGGVLINQAIHTFDLLLWLTGPVKTVEASISTKRLSHTIEVEDTADVLMTGISGQRILFYATNCYVKNVPVELELICENGSLKQVGNTVTAIVNGEVTVADYSSGTVLGKDYWGSGHGLLIEDFYQCIREERDFPVSGEAAMVSVELLEAVYQSGKEHVTVELMSN